MLVRLNMIRILVGVPQESTSFCTTEHRRKERRHARFEKWEKVVWNPTGPGGLGVYTIAYSTDILYMDDQGVMNHTASVSATYVTAWGIQDSVFQGFQLATFRGMVCH